MQGAFDASNAPLYKMTAAKVIAYLVEKTEAALTEALNDPLDVVKSAARELVAYYTNAATSANKTEVSWAKRYTAALALLHKERSAAAAAAEIRSAAAEAAAASSEEGNAPLAAGETGASEMSTIDKTAAETSAVRVAASGEEDTRVPPSVHYCVARTNATKRTVLPTPRAPLHVVSHCSLSMSMSPARSQSPMTRTRRRTATTSRPYPRQAATTAPRARRAPRAARRG